MPSVPGFTTRCLKINLRDLDSYTVDELKNDPKHESLRQAARTLTDDEVIAVPTETVYGLAANALSSAAVAKIYAAKNRPADNPLIVHISSLDMLGRLLHGSSPTASDLERSQRILSLYQPVIDQYWPGPLTILIPKSDLVPNSVTCNQDTVGVRFPAHPTMKALIDLCGFPLAAPSANLSGKPSPTIAKHVLDDLSGRIPLVLDGGACDIGIESTVLDGLRVPPAILRPGKITAEDLIDIPGFEETQTYQSDFVDKQLEENPTTPGMKYRHYSPNATVLILQKNEHQDELKSTSDSQAFVQAASRLTKEIKTGSADARIALLTSTTTVHEQLPHIDFQDQIGPSVSEVSHNLFRCFRDLDDQGFKYIIVEGVAEVGEGMALMNRLKKASADRIYY
jgi:L-threonylcarbamoyladenylate synthase